MNYTDVIKKSVVETFDYAQLPTSRILITLGITFVIAIYIYFVYRFITKSDFYFKNFNVSMAIISVVTAGIVLAMQSSIVISLGMVGALSIVRFRTAIKDPMDLLFLFWSIGVGIICGAGLFKVAIILSLVVTIGIVCLDLLPVKMSTTIMIVNAENRELEEKIVDLIKENQVKYRIKSKTVTGNSLDMIMEIKEKKGCNITDIVSKLDGVIQVSLLTNLGEIKGV